jgi:hypothetical protein
MPISFVRSFGHVKGHDPVKPEARQQQRDDTEDTQDRCQSALPAEGFGDLLPLGSDVEQRNARIDSTHGFTHRRNDRRRIGRRSHLERHRGWRGLEM